MYAIVATGGKQYKVSKGDLLEVEKLNAGVGESVALNVVFIADGSTFTTENDKLAVAKVFAEVVEHFKGDKQLIFKFKKRKSYKRTRGHRQNLTRLLIKDISLTGEEPKKTTRKAAEKKPAADMKKTEKESVSDVQVEKKQTVVKATETKTVEAKTTVRKTAASKTDSKASAAAKTAAAKTTTAKTAAAKPAAAKTAVSKTATTKTASTRAKKTVDEKVETAVKEDKPVAATKGDDKKDEKKPARKAPAKKTSDPEKATE